MKKGAFTFSILGLFLVGVVFVLVNLSAGKTTFFGRASTPGMVSLEGCRLFASPVISKAGGEDKIRVTAFVLDDTGKGIANKSVSLNCKELSLCQNAGITFTPVQPGTDTSGQAIYDISSPVPGNFELQASVGGLAIPQTVTVVFK